MGDTAPSNFTDHLSSKTAALQHVLDDQLEEVMTLAMRVVDEEDAAFLYRCTKLAESSPLLQEAADVRADRLSSDEYDETTWSARTWSTFVAQRISVALHRATALEILQSLRMGPVEGRDLY